MAEQVVRLTVNFAVNSEQLARVHEDCAGDDRCERVGARHAGYDWYVSADGKRFRLVETYANASAIEAHFMGPAVQQWVPQIVPISRVDGFEIYGDPGPMVAQMAGGLGAVIYPYWMGINR